MTHDPVAFTALMLALHCYFRRDNHPPSLPSAIALTFALLGMIVMFWEILKGWLS